MATKNSHSVHHSPKLVEKAAKALGNEKSSGITKSLAGSILGGLAQEKHQTCKPTSRKK